MKSMKKLVGLAMLAGAVVGASSTAQAEVELSGNVAMTSDYVFRGISQTDASPAIQGGFDLGAGMFYAGVWGSSVDFKGYSDESATMELDLYAGITPSTGPVDWDLGVIGYFYPSADDDLNFDFYELYAAPSFAITDAFGVGAALSYSPEFFGDTGEGLYVEINGSYAVTDALSLSAAFGNQDVDDIGDYDTWNIGASYAVAGFDLGLTYVDTEGADDPSTWGLSETLTDGRIVFSIGRSL